MQEEEEGTEWRTAWQALLVTCGLAGVYTIVAAWVPWLRSFPVLSWLGAALMCSHALAPAQSRSAACL